jgi:hypothetical protein
MAVGKEFSDDFASSFDPDNPKPRTYIPEWLSPVDVKDWLRLNDQDTTDDDLIVAVCSQSEPYVERCRPEWRTELAGDDGTTSSLYDPDAETYRGAVMFAARLYVRRSSPSGIQLYGDAPSFVARYDPDIDRALRTGAFMAPALG